MIVISGALVLVALVLLIIGVVGPELTFVYASIAVSLVSLVFLVIGILQRRGETAPAPESSPAAPAPSTADRDAEGVTAVIPAQESRGSRKVTPEPPVAETADEELETGGTVLVVEGRPRYHVDGCRYLTGKEVEEVDVLDARDEGFTPCGVCKPDEVLAQEEADLLAEEEAYDDAPTTEQPVVEESDLEEPVVEEDVPGVEVPPARAKAPAKKAAKKAPAKAATRSAAKAPATRAVSATSTRTSSKAPSKAATAAAAASPAAATAAKKPGSVVVIPDRGKFHRAECRYVRDVDGAEVLSKSAASRQGYAACGVCKP